MGRRVLVVASPTLDIISGPWGRETRPGGPLLYVALAARRLGYEVYGVGPYGYSVLETVRLEALLGAQRLCCLRTGVGAVFSLEYDRAGNRREEYLGGSLTLSTDEVISVYERVKPDILVVAPVYGEITYGVARLLYALHGPCTGLDVQGFQRAGLGCPPPHTSGIVHGSPSELGECSYEGGEWLRVETRGPEPFYTFTRWGERLETHPGQGILSDPTGAGDIFLFSLLHALCYEGMPVGDALAYASGLVYEVLSGDSIRALAFKNMHE